MASPREIIATTFGQNLCEVAPYQAGRHKPTLWTMGDQIFCTTTARTVPPAGHAGYAWAQSADQSIARANGRVLWESSL